MDKFITYRERNKKGDLCYYVCQKEYPNYLGIVSVGFMPDMLISVPIGGYNLYINFAGVLSGKFIPNYKYALNEVDGILLEMANFFLNNRIQLNPNKYKKFKLNDTTRS